MIQKVRSAIMFFILISFLLTYVWGFGERDELFRAISVDQYRSSFLSQSTAISKPAAQTGAAPSRRTRQNNAETSASLPVIFVPSFQGSLLYDCSDKRRCRPLFLSPLAPHMYRSVYKSLLLSSTTALPHIEHSAEYPSFTCPPSPLSHIGHCNALPARGAIHDFITNLTSSTPALDLKILSYDWRQSMPTLLSASKSSFVKTLSSLLDGNAARHVIVAHGTACRLVSHFLNSHRRGRGVSAVICVAPARPEDATDALHYGTGLLTDNTAAHVHADACTNVRDGSRLDFSQVDGELGLSKRRRKSMPHPAGPWDIKEPQVVSSTQERIALARALQSVTELAGTDGRVPVIDDVNHVVCVEAEKNDHRTDTLACDAVQGTSEVIRFDTHKYDLVGLAADIVRKFAETNN